jgi:integrase
VNYVEPIRDKDKIEEIAKYLKNNNTRNYIMFGIGIYSGLRISDILKLKVRDVKSRDVITIREVKTKKLKTFAINPNFKKELNKYCENKEPNEYLIKSREGINKPITREMAYTILRETGEMFGVDCLGTHSLRKTFGYHFYLKYKDVVSLQKLFNHTDPSITLRYIGIEQSYFNKLMKAMNFNI